MTDTMSQNKRGREGWIYSPVYITQVICLVTIRECLGSVHSTTWGKKVKKHTNLFRIASKVDTWKPLFCVLIFIFFYLYLFVCDSVCVNHICVGAHRGQKWMSCPLAHWIHRQL